MTQETRATAQPKTIRSRVRRALYKSWGRADQGSFRYRLWDAIQPRPWWDWGHAVMSLTGRASCGNFDPPRGRDMWYRRDPDSGHMVTTYTWPGMNAQDEEWHIFDVQDGGHTIKMGYANGGGFYGLDRTEQRMFLRWFIVECKLRGEWLGLRRWMYYKALHAAVNRKIPFTCQAIPSRRSGGYNHWHCHLPRKHTGEHRFHNYTWSERGKVEYAPREVST